MLSFFSLHQVSGILPQDAGTVEEEVEVEMVEEEPPFLRVCATFSLLMVGQLQVRARL